MKYPFFHSFLVVVLVFALFFSIFGVRETALAQVGTIETGINVEMIPENPGPNKTVQVSLESFGTDLNSADIFWVLNGKTVKSGKGEKVFNFTTGDMGTLTTLEISVVTREGEKIRKIYKIRPGAIDLIWHAETFVPPFYKGKALFTHQSTITFIAIPHLTNSSGVEISASNLIYTWKLNGSVVESLSGYGKNAYTLTGSVISRPIEVSVEVASADKTVSGFKNTTLNPLDPTIIFYEKNPLFGIEFQKGLLGKMKMESNEILVVAMPYFFGTKNREAPELTYKWAINNKSLTTSSARNSTQVFRKQEGVSGSSNISLSIENSKKILEYAKSNFNLEFDDKNTEN